MVNGTQRRLDGAAFFVRADNLPRDHVLCIELGPYQLDPPRSDGLNDPISLLGHQILELHARQPLIPLFLIPPNDATTTKGFKDKSKGASNRKPHIGLEFGASKTEI